MKTTPFTFVLAAVMALQTLGMVAGAKAQTAAGSPHVPSPTPYQIVERGANHQVWERTVYEPGPNGTVVGRNHRYTELCSGLNFWQNGRWQPSRAQIDLLPPGAAFAAAATNGQHQAWFPLDIYQGVIKLSTPKGRQLLSRPVGLFYEDDSNSVLFAILTNSVGELVGSNEVVYPNAFEGASASISYKYTRSSFSQDIVIQGQLPNPAALGLNPARTRLGVLTAFFDTNNPVAAPGPMDPADGLSDTTLTFAGMEMAAGQAFSMGGTNHQFNLRRGGTPTYKRWFRSPGRTGHFLMEEVPYHRVSAQLEQLPPQTGRLYVGTTNLLAANSLLNEVPARLLSVPARGVPPKPEQMRLARREDAQTRALVLDYMTLDTDSNNFTFQADTTYYINGVVNLSGTTTFEGGTVLKYPESFNNPASLNVGPDLVFQTAPYHPAVFTSQNDDSVGEQIGGSSGQPAQGGADYLRQESSLGDSPPAIRNARFSYAATGVAVTDPKLWDVQFNQCGWAVDDLDDINPTIALHNVLFHWCSIVTGQDSYQGGIVEGEQVTVNGCDVLGEGNNLHLTNSIFANCGNSASSANGSHNGFYRTDEFGDNARTNTAYPFQTVGAAQQYLATNSIFHGIGTRNIDPAVLDDIAAKTTYLPIVYSNITISVAEPFSPQAQRDTNTAPDLGYHYDPIDYFFGGVTAVTNITFTAGTAIGWFPLPGSSWTANGISLSNGVTATFNGTVTMPCVAASCTTVQEGDGLWQNYGGLGVFAGGGSYNPSNPGELIARFTRFSNLANGMNFRDGPAGQPLRLHATDCEFYRAGGGYNLQLAFTNCLFYRAGVGQATSDSQYSWETYREIYRNCTFYGGQINWTHWESAPYWQVSVRDCSFDQGVVFNISAPNDTWLDDGYNAYLTNAATLPNSVGSDVIVTNFNWQSNWFGDFYLPSSSPLINVGDQKANLLGLYHFTTQTNLVYNGGLSEYNQVPETNSIVDIGYHYVATDQYGDPLDSNGDGVPDYLEDANGNGVVDTGETNWALAIIIGPASQTVMQGSNATFSVTAGGVSPLSYQWYWEGAPLSDAGGVSGSESATLNLNGVNPDQAGGYSVVVSNSFGSVTSAPLAVLTVLLSQTNRYDTPPLYIMPPYADWNVADMSDPAQPVNIGELQAPFTKPSYGLNANVPPVNTPWHTNAGMTFTEAYGTTASGGLGEGTVFKMDPAGPLQGIQPNELVQRGNKLYGTTAGLNGTFFNGYGTIFSINTNGSGFTTLYSFNETPYSNDGWQPEAGLVLSGSTLYGTTYSGGVHGYGTVFSFNITNGVFTHLYDFTGTTNGAYPFAKLTLCGNILYGSTYSGGADNKGTVFEINTDGTGYRVLHSFSGEMDGEDPAAPLLFSGGTLYGTTPGGGTHGLGTVFSINTNGTVFTTLHNFDRNDGSQPESGLMISGSTLYGTTEYGGANGDGTVFTINTNGADYIILHSFDDSNTNDGAYPAASLSLTGNTLYGTALIGGRANDGAVFSINTSTGYYTNLYYFQDGSDGQLPDTALVLSGNTLFGTTFGDSYSVGDPNYGTIFSIHTDGSDFTVLSSFSIFAVIHTFTGLDGANPCAQLALSGSMFYGIPTTVYGTTFSGGTYGYGTVFKVNTDGTGFTNLYEFTGGSDGRNPQTGLLISGNTLYGTTTNSIFKINTDGSDFACLTNIDGASRLILSLSGKTLYGTTANGGSYHYGSVFRIKTDGSGFTNVHSFTGGVNGAYPASGLEVYGVGIRLYNGLTNRPCILYGTTYSGGANDYGMLFSVHTDGRSFTDLHDFDWTNDGAHPLGGLLVTNNNVLTEYGDTNMPTYLVGTTSTGGTNGGGTVFGMNLDGSDFQTLYSFGGVAGAGSQPEGKLASLGNLLYGTTSGGGAYTNGMVFGINSDGSGLTDLYDFSGGEDGGSPLAGLTLTVADNDASIWSLDTTINVSAENVTNLSYSIAMDNCDILFVNGNYVSWTNHSNNAQWSLYSPLTHLHEGENDIRLIIGGDDDTNDYFAMAAKSAFTNILFGTTYYGGSNGDGTIFETSPEGNDVVLHTFFGATDGKNPIGDLVLSGNTLYGVTENGGTNSGLGTVFRVNTNGSDFETLYTFANTSDGANPLTGLTLSGNTLYGTTHQGGAHNLGTIFKINTDGSGYRILYNLDANNNGENQGTPLLLVSNILYGTTYSGGAYGAGTIFCVGTNGLNYQTLYNFGGGSDGSNPEGRLTVSSNTLYGTTYSSGSYGVGTIFSFTIGGTSDKILYSFANTPDGAYPQAGLTLSGNTLYGTSYQGGAHNLGTVFSIDIDGNGYTNLLSLGSFDSDYGKNPQADLLILGNSLYGTTYYGGANGYGMVFVMKSNGTDFNDIYDFKHNQDGANPYGGVCSP